MKLTAEQRVEKAHVAIMGHPATLAYSSIIMLGETRIDDYTPTAFTNGRDKTYGRAFVEKLTDAELVGVIIHEAGHVMYQHGFLWKHLWKISPRLANAACDYVLNLEIDEMHKQYPSFIKLPSMALLDYRFKGMDSQEVFEILKKERGKGGGDKEKQPEGDGQTKGDGQTEGSGTDGFDNFDEHDFSELSEQERKDMQGEIENAIRQGALLASKQSGNLHKAFTDLMAPKVDWREQLREFIATATQGKDDSTWRKPNRRWLQHDVYMPSTISEAIGTMAVVVDSSGSIFSDEALLSSFMSEIISICNTVSPEAVHMIVCDDEVKSHSLYTRDEYDRLANVRSFHGGGGTDMRKALDFIEKNNLDPEVVIVLTDGYTPYPTTLAKPTLWAITEKGVTAPIGSSISIA